MDLALSARARKNFEGTEDSNPLKPKNIDVSKEADTQYRNQIMSEVMIKAIETLKVNNTLAIVGGFHLQGLMTKTELTQHYEVLAINAADRPLLPSMMANDDEVRLSRYLFSRPVLQARIPGIKSHSSGRELSFLISQNLCRAKKAHDRAENAHPKQKRLPTPSIKEQNFLNQYGLGERKTPEQETTLPTTAPNKQRRRRLLRGL